MLKKLKNKLTLENLICIFIIICPILDITSFVYRNYFNTSLSPTTILRPIIPSVVFIILFFKENNKKKKIGIAAIYLIYDVIHLKVFQKLHNESSYGNIRNEIQYLINYSFFIINIYNFKAVIKDQEKIQKSVFISLAIYIISLFFSIVTKTSSSTYLEGIGYKGYFESGNSLCTVLLLGLCIILSNFNKKEWRKLILIALIGIYLTIFSGMRTGLFGFIIIIGFYGILKFLEMIGKITFKNVENPPNSKSCIDFVQSTILFKNVENLPNSKGNKHWNANLILTIIATILIIFLICLFGAKNLDRRKMLKQNEQNNIDIETGHQRYVTGDILNLYKQIQKGEITEEYMSKQEQNAIIKLCEFCEKIKLSNVNLRAQQLIYNIFLVKEQKSLQLILFGNGYKNQTGELVMEMEVPSLILNFGLIGFMLYLAPYVAIFTHSLYKIYIQKKKITQQIIMNVTGVLLALALSLFSGYVFFNLSCMTMSIVLVQKETQE